MEQSIVQKLKRQVILFLARRLPPCNVLLPLLSKEHERPLTLRERITKNLHLFTCQACRRYVLQIEKMSQMVKPKIEEKISVIEDKVSVEPAVKLSDDARNRIRAALETAARNKN